MREDETDLCDIFKGVARDSPPILTPKNCNDDDCWGAGCSSCYPVSYKNVHYMMLHACSRTKEQRLEGVVGQDTDQRERKTTETGKNNNLEDKGGRGDRLSPVGILNPCGFAPIS